MAENLEPGTNEVRRRDQLDKQASRKYTREEDRTDSKGVRDKLRFFLASKAPRYGPKSEWTCDSSIAIR